jgi:hypothetical protein
MMTIGTAFEAVKRERDELLEALRSFAPPKWYGDLDTDASGIGPIMTFYHRETQEEFIIRRSHFRRAQALVARCDARDAREKEQG